MFYNTMIAQTGMDGDEELHAKISALMAEHKKKKEEIEDEGDKENVIREAKKRPVHAHEAVHDDEDEYEEEPKAHKKKTKREDEEHEPKKKSAEIEILSSISSMVSNFEQTNKSLADKITVLEDKLAHKSIETKSNVGSEAKSVSNKAFDLGFSKKAVDAAACYIKGVKGFEFNQDERKLMRDSALESEAASFESIVSRKNADPINSFVARAEIEKHHKVGDTAVTKNFYNTQIAEQGGLLAEPFSSTWQSRFYASSVMLSLARLVATTTRETQVIIPGRLPTTTYVPEQIATVSVPLADAGQVTSKNIKNNGFYQNTITITEQYMQFAQAMAMSLIQNMSAISTSIAVANDMLLGTGEGGRPRGILTLPEFDITSLPLQQYQIPTQNQMRIYKNGSTTILDPDVLIKLTQTIVPMYGNQPGGLVWLMNPQTWAVVQTLKDTMNNYLFNRNEFLQYGPEFIRSNVAINDLGDEILRQTYSEMPSSVRQVNLLMGYPVILDPEMPDIAANGYPIVFGNIYSSYTITQAVGLGIRYVPVGSVNGGVAMMNGFARGFQTYINVGGDVTNPQAYTVLKMAV